MCFKPHYLWLMSLFLLLVPVEAQSITCVNAPTSRLIVGEQARVIAEGGSNLRVRPSADAILLDIVPPDTLVPVIEGPFCGGGYAWWQIDYGDNRGWVAEGFNTFYWLEPFVVQRTQLGSIRLEIQPTLVDNIRSERLSDPARYQFVLEGYPIESNRLIPFIVVFDQVPDSAPMIDNAAQRQGLESGERAVQVRFAEQPTTTDDVYLAYRYMFATGDNRFVDAYFPIVAPNLPLPFNPPIEEAEFDNYLETYLAESMTALDRLDVGAFSPTLAQLDGIIQSLQLNASLADSDRLHYASNGIIFDYHPTLATEIQEAVIPATQSVPRHIELRFIDDGRDAGAIQLYRTEDIPSNTRLMLQQVLQRQPASIPMITLPALTDTINERDNLLYLNSMTGSGLRYLATLATERRQYIYIGIYADESYFVTATFSLSDDEGNALWLDELLQSLQIGGS